MKKLFNLIITVGGT